APAENRTIRIGNVVFWRDIYGFGHPVHTATYIAGIYGATTSDAGSTIPVYVDMNGKLGTAASSERFKTAIKPMDKGSEALLALKPVTFHYKNDSKNIPQFGLVAEEVEKVNPALVARDADGKVYTVRYDAVNAMLLNEFLKAHHTMQEQGGTIVELKKQVAILAETVKEQAAQIQKVSAQLELNKAAPQTV